MSALDSAYFPHHLDLESFIADSKDKGISASKMQDKYKISPRQYRIVMRYLREEHSRTSNYKCVGKYIYRTRYNKYSVRKKIDGNFKYFGTYDTLEEALEYRDNHL